MATESVNTPAQRGFQLPFDAMNRAGDLLAQARGIAAVVGLAAQYEDQIPQHSISHACWAIQDILNEVEQITSSKHPLGCNATNSD